MSDPTWPYLIGKILAHESLTVGEAEGAMEKIMEGEVTPAQFGAFVAGLRSKGETVEEILGLVATMRRLSDKVEVPFDVVDTCGTGGDRAGTINVSTIAAFVVAGAGGKVAKHGNRAASSLCGSADLLEELGVKIDLGPLGVASCIDEAGIGFCFAPVFHPSMRHAGPPRRELGVPTIFNFLGPLTNPAGARRQALGVSDPSMAPKMVEVLHRLGSTHVIAFSGSDGLDEITTSGPSTLWELRNDRVKESQFDPASLGIAYSPSEAIKGGGPSENAKIALDVLSGAGGPARDIVALNAAAALVAAGLAESLSQGVEQALEALGNGKARSALDALIEVSNGAV